MMSSTEIEKALNIIFGFEFGVFGITITLFTVIYSFMLNKRGELLIFNDIFKRKKTESPILNQKISFARSYIKKSKKLNLHLMILAVISLTISMSTYFLILFSINDCTVYVMLTFTFITLIYILTLLIVIFVKFLKETNI
jgi:hypothetical protein